MGDRDERRGLNEAVFRTVNEQIAELGDRSLTDRIEIVCECSNGTCLEPLLVSASEYEEAREDPTTFIVHAGHEDPVVERVVGRHQDHLLVQKFGEAAEVAIATDPARSPVTRSVRAGQAVGERLVERRRLRRCRHPRVDQRGKVGRERVGLM